MNSTQMKVLVGLIVSFLLGLIAGYIYLHFGRKCPYCGSRRTKITVDEGKGIDTDIYRETTMRCFSCNKIYSKVEKLDVVD